MHGLEMGVEGIFQAWRWHKKKMVPLEGQRGPGSIRRGGSTDHRAAGREMVQLGRAVQSLGGEDEKLFVELS